MRCFLATLVIFLSLYPLCAQQSAIQIQETADDITIDTDALQAKIRKKGYVSGIAAGTFLDKKTGARDAGFGLHIMDFLMAPGWRDDGYSRDPKVHGHGPLKSGGSARPELRGIDLSKHYVEGPQICTKAKQ